MNLLMVSDWSEDKEAVAGFRRSLKARDFLMFIIFILTILKAIINSK